MNFFSLEISKLDNIVKNHTEKKPLLKSKKGIYKNKFVRIIINLLIKQINPNTKFQNIYNKNEILFVKIVNYWELFP